MKKTLLLALADYELMLRQPLIEKLESYGDCKIIIDAGNGKELCDKIKQSDIVPDLCIFDLDMPVMNGFKTIEELRKHNPEIKILALSRIEDDICISRLLDLGANGYLCKSRSYDLLHDAILCICTTGHFFGELYAKILSGYYKKYRLTNTQSRCLELIAKGNCNKQIAADLHISESAVNQHRTNLTKKLNVNTRTELVVFASRLGLLA